MHPHLFMSPDSDTEDEYSDPDEGFERKLEGHLVGIGEPFTSYYLATHALRYKTAGNHRGESRRRTPYREDRDKEVFESDQAGLPTDSARAPSRAVASSSDSDGSSSTFRQRPRIGDEQPSYRRGRPSEDMGSDSYWECTGSDTEPQPSSAPRPYDAPRDRSARTRRAFH